MNKHNESDWEKHWQKEFSDFAPPTHAEDWQGMQQLLDTKVPARAHHLIEQDTTGSLLKTLKRPFLKLSRQKWLGIVMLVAGIGYWLGTTHSENIYGEISKGVILQDTLPPSGSQIQQPALPEEHQLLPPDDSASAIIYRIDTTYSLDSLGNLTGISSIDTAIIYLPGI